MNPSNSPSPLVIAGMRRLGAASFAIDPASTTCRAGLSLAQGRACTIGIVFAPAARGVQSGSLRLMDNARNAPQIVNFDGAGL